MSSSSSSMNEVENTSSESTSNVVPSTSNSQNEDILSLNNTQSSEEAQCSSSGSHESSGVDDEKSWSSYFQWCKFSLKELREMERCMLSGITLPITFRNVNIGPIVGHEDCKIWTLCVNDTADSVPIVLLHGFGSGLALWSLNLNELAINHPVYAFDILGFGQSSRPKFSSLSHEVETEFISSIEAWRVAMKLSKFVIVGHSFGGYLSTLYSIRYPSVIEHLILADPWGFKDKPVHIKEIANISWPILMFIRVTSPFNLSPLWPIRVFGRLSPTFIQYFRNDLIQNFIAEIKDANRVLSNYIFQINAQNPTGETAFLTLMVAFGWAKHPLNHRLHLLDERIPLTIVYGTKSWIDHASAEEIQERRGATAFVDTHMIEGSGHHVYTENRPQFNKIVLQACMNTRSSDDIFKKGTNNNKGS